jgi:hypothetical protein
MLIKNSHAAQENEIDSLRLLMWNIKAKYVLTLGMFDVTKNYVQQLKKKADKSYYRQLKFDIIRKNLDLCYKSSLKGETHPAEDKINIQRAAEKFTVGKGLPDHPDVKALFSNFLHKYEPCDEKLLNGMLEVHKGSNPEAAEFIKNKFNTVAALRVLIDTGLITMINETVDVMNSAPENVEKITASFKSKNRTQDEIEKFDAIENEIKIAIAKIKTDINPLSSRIHEISETVSAEISRIDFVEAQ